MLAALLLAFVAFSAFAQTDLSHPDKNTLIVEDAPEMEVFAFGKKVIVKKSAKGVLSFGGDVIVEGRVSGEVATIGGTVVQKKGAFIGGDVIIFGGSYRAEDVHPLRNSDKQTVVYAGYEQELREMARSPSRIFSPDLSVAFLLQRLLSLFFWFGISLLITLITPGAVSRAVTRLQIEPLKVFGIGGLTFVVVTLGVMVGFGVLPGYISGIVSLMAFVLIMLAYVFGRVAMQAGVGKWLLRRFQRGGRPSETLALLLGALVWTILLSIPYLWTAALFVLFTGSLGLVLTARAGFRGWKRSPVRE